MLRNSLGCGLFAFALLSLSTAHAQDVIVPSAKQRTHPPISWTNGAKYDMWNRSVAEHHLRKMEAKLARDEERGDFDAVDHDLRRIQELKFRIAADCFLVNQIMEQRLGYYPRRIDEMSLMIKNDAVRPPDYAIPMQTGIREFSITLVNTLATDVALSIDGMPYKALGNTRQTVFVTPSASLEYNGGGTLGERQYPLSPGVYEFRSAPEGVVLYKVSETP